MAVGPELADRLERRMRDLGMTQRQLADRVGVNQGTISRIMTGHPSPHVAAVCGALGIAPPMVEISDPVQHRLLTAGSRLLELAPEQYLRHLDEIERLVDALEATRDEKSDE